MVGVSELHGMRFPRVQKSQLVLVSIVVREPSVSGYL